MVNRIRGITIQLDGDTKPLEKALGDVNARSRDLQKELRDVDRLLKFNPGNTELIAQKQQLLGEQVENTSRKLQQLREAEEQVQDAFRRGDIKEEQYRAFQREVTETESKLRHFQGQLNDTKPLLDRVSDSLDQTSEKFRKTGDSMKSAGRSLSTQLTAPIVAAGAGFFKVSMDFESAFANFRKVTDATEAEFEDFKNAFRELSKEIPVSTEEIANVAAAASQLGIAKENVLGFTETMLAMGVASDLTSEQASFTFARLANITNMPQENFDRLGATVVELGNNFAATESEIAEMALRIAGAGSQVNMTESDILGFSAALASVGINAEAGGTAISKLMIEMASEVDQGGERLEEFARVAGMSVKDFQRAFQEDAATAIFTFLGGLGDLSEQGESAFGIIDQLGLSEIRLRDTILRTSNAREMANEALQTANQAWIENTALQDEANERYATTESRLIMMWNAIKDVALTMGDALVPAVMGLIEVMNPLINWISELAERFESLDESTRNTILVVAGLVAAIGPLLLILGAMASSIGSVITVISRIIPLIGSLGKSLMFLAANPVGIIVTAIAGLVAGLVYLYNTNEEVREKLNAVWNFLKRAAESIFGSIQRFWRRWGSDITSFFQSTWNFITNLFNTVLNAIRGLIQSVFGGIRSFWDEWGGKITESFRNLFEILKLLFQAAFGVIQLTVSTIFDGIRSFWDRWGSLITTYFRTIFNVLKTLFEGTWNNIRIYIETIMNVIKSLFEGTWNNIKIFIETTIDVIYNMIKLFLSILKGDWEGAWDAIKGIVESVWNGIMNTFGNVYETMSKIGKDIIQGLVDGVKSMASAAINAAKEVARGVGDSVKDFFRISSPSKLMMSYGSDVGEGLAVGIQQSVNAVKQQAQALSNAAVNAINIPTLDTAQYNNRLGAAGSQSGGVVQNITINSPEPLSPTETARRNLQASRQLAMEWGLS